MSNVQLPLGGFGKESIVSLLDRAKDEMLGLLIEGEGSVTAFEQNISKVKAIYPGRWDNIMVCIPSVPATIFLMKKSVELSD